LIGNGLGNKLWRFVVVGAWVLKPAEAKNYGIVSEGNRRIAGV
jgi:hypothetical protein